MKITKQKVLLVVIFSIVFLLFLNVDIHILNGINSFAKYGYNIRVGGGYCELRGGEMMFYDVGGHYDRYDTITRCNLKYLDGGKQCASSSDCNGNCIVTDEKIDSIKRAKEVEYLPEICELLPDSGCEFKEEVDLIGQCETYPDNGCEFMKAYWVLLNPQIIKPGNHCTDVP